MSAPTPQISILVPTYNRRQLLLEGLRSILNQSYTDFEVVVVDNCSSDDTTEVVAALNDPRIVYLRNDMNIGPVNNHNRALRTARGKYIYFFSDDDVMLPDNLLRKVQVLEQNPSVGFVHSDFKRIDGDGNITGEHHWASDYAPLARIYQLLLKEPLMVQATAFRELYYGWNFIGMPTVMVRASVLRENRLEMNNQLNYLYDWDLWLKLALKTDFYYLNEVLVLYRLHTNNDSRAFNSQVYFREMMLSKLGMLNLFHQTALHGRNYPAELSTLIKRQLKDVKFYETYVKEQVRHFRGYLKRTLPENTVQRLKRLVD